MVFVLGRVILKYSYKALLRALFDVFLLFFFRFYRRLLDLKKNTYIHTSVVTLA